MVTDRYSMEISSQPDVLVAEDLRKSYGPRQALQGLTFSLKAGRILGFLGPNGAGKTTSIRILTTMLVPDSGHFVLDGVNSRHPEQIRRKIGVLPEDPGFSRQMTGLEYLIYFGQLDGLTNSEARQTAQILIRDVGLRQRSKSLISSYSPVMKQMLGIACALINNPVVIFLDEPTLGLDPRDQRELLELIRQIAQERNTAVVLSSHILTEIERVCDDVLILNLGKVVAWGSVDEVIGRVQRNITLRNSIRVQVPPAAVRESQQVLEGMINILKLTHVNEAEGCLEMELVPGSNGSFVTTYQVNNKILRTLIRAHIPIVNFGSEGGHLPDIFPNFITDGIK
ncbi:MAG TPA: ABC transporter ATP-binding protein [Anaerolineales bacterium]|nr:ABC transporter ATP-binding protein [Anaerolineales bacterium]